MKRIQLKTKKELEKAIKKAADVIRGGGLIIYPTDTLYGIGVDASLERALEKVFALKGRNFKKPISVIVSDINMARRYVKMNELAEKLAEKVLPGAFTFILPKKDVVSPKLTVDHPGLGFRIPDSHFCIGLAKEFDGCITATSANISGSTDERSVDKILKQFEGKHNLIDLVIDAGELPKKDPSTVLRILDDDIEILREGNTEHTAFLSETRGAGK